MTVDRAVVLLDPRFDRHAVHVAASRARDETRLVVDRSQINALLSSDYRRAAIRNIQLLRQNSPLFMRPV
jgi:ATP-dependent exoDNAse (exonuclease V) alpha subunit